MKKIKQILTGVLLIMTLSVFTACGNNGTAPDEVDTTNENTENTESTADDEKQNADKDDKNNNNAKDNADNNATDNENMTDDAGIDNGDTVSEGPKVPEMQVMEQWTEQLQRKGQLPGIWVTESVLLEMASEMQWKMSAMQWVMW